MVADDAAAGHVAAASVGVRPAPRPAGLDARYVRDPMIDLARDVVPIGPRPTWAGDDLDGDLLALGVRPDALAEAAAWIDQLDRAGGILHPDVCRSPAHVAEFAERFVPDGLAVLGVGLAADQVDGFLAERAAFLGEGADGLVQMLRDRRPLVPGYRVLGYEPVSVHYGGLNCSWTCNHLQGRVAEATGIEPNEHGFLDGAEEAAAVMAFLADPAVGKEPGIWRAWLVVRYDPG